MKHLLTFAILGIVLMSETAHAQFKIGNIEVTESVFTAYILDCHKKPDTLESMHFRTGTYRQEEVKEIKDHNEYLRKYGTALYTWNKAYNDSIWTNLIWVSGDTWPETKKRRGKLVRIDPVKAGTYKVYNGKYTIPRTPNEIDFVKWYGSKYRKP